MQPSDTQAAELMPARIQQLEERTRALWWASDAQALPSLPVVSASDKRTHEAALERLVEHARAATRASVATADDRLALQHSSLAAFGELANTALGFTQAQLDLLGQGFMPALSAFAAAARRFDHTLSGACIFQAGRNVSILNALQAMLGLPVALTPSITAYSLLYPYTDNYLDDPGVPVEDKVAFNDRLRRRLGGENVEAANAHERAILALVDMIESQYTRERHPGVFASLLAIQHAQERSLQLLGSAPDPFSVDVLGITLEKGGASVLADGYIVAGMLTPEQEEFAFGWGALLQLADDLQDVRTDARDGLATLFSLTARRATLDRLSIRTLHFGRQVLSAAAAVAAPGAAPLAELMQRSTDLLLLDAIGRARRQHSSALVQEAERHFPFRLSALKRARRRLSRRRLAFTRLIESYSTAVAER